MRCQFHFFIYFFVPAFHCIYFFFSCLSEAKIFLKKTTYNNILRLKFRLVKKMIIDNLKNLNNESENINEEEIMKIHNKLKSTEMEIAKQLGNVTSI